MKYEITPITEKSTFKPFTVTLTFETEEEYVNFHDNVMHNLTHSGCHQFHGDVFNAGRGKLESTVRGDI